jgi:hypothetical protein
VPRHVGSARGSRIQHALEADAPRPMEGKHLERSVVPMRACGYLVRSATASSTFGMRKRHSGTAALTPLFVRSMTDRTGHGVPSRSNARTSEARFTMWSAEQTAPFGSFQRPSQKALILSIFSM